MPLIQPKQVRKLIAGRITLVGFASAGDPAENVSAQLTAALATAGDGNTAVPNQVAVGNVTPGVITAAGKNTVEIYDSATKKKLVDANENEIYGRITQPAAGVWEVSTFSNVNGTETAALLPAGSYDYVIPYLYTFTTLPWDFATTLKASYVQDDPQAGAPRMMKEVLAPTALNTLPGLSQLYTSGEASLIVNGQVVSSLTGAVVFTAGTNTVTWDPLVAKYNLATTDVCIAVYPY